jgi:hypothetical protein
MRRRGHADATLYGEHELGGLNVLYVLNDRPSSYGLPENPRVATRNVLGNWLGGVATAGLLTAIPLWVLFKRRDALAAQTITHQEED